MKCILMHIYVSYQFRVRSLLFYAKSAKADITNQWIPIKTARWLISVIAGNNTRTSQQRS